MDPSTEQAKLEEQSHLKSALGVCGYKPRTVEKALKPKLTNGQTTATNRSYSSSPGRNTTIPYISGLSEKVRRVYRAHNYKSTGVFQTV